MASKIQGRDFDVDIKPYEFNGDDYNNLRVHVDYEGRYFTATLTPEKIEQRDGYQSRCFRVTGTRDPLGSWLVIYINQSPRNSQKTIDTMHAALMLAKSDIAYLFDLRRWDMMKSLVTNVAQCGYTSEIEDKMRDFRMAQEATNNENINNQNNNETMAKNLKAADLIGKVIIVGDNIATITVKSVEGETLKCEFKNGDRPAVPMPISIEQVESNIKVGIWKLEGAAETATESATATAEEPIAQAEAASEDDVQEVEDIEPAKPEEPIAEEEPAKAKTVKMESAKPKKSDKKSEAKPTAETGGESAGTLKYTTYTTSKGKTGAKITGLKETDAAYQQAGEIHGSASWENKNGKKLYYIAFGPKYAEAAKSICQVLNADKTDEQKLAECKVIIASADQERAERKEASKAKRETWKAEHPEGKAEKPAKETKGKASTTKGEKTYTQKELAEWLRKLNAGDPKAAEFFENIAKAA